jgi:hypothetical protein
MALAKRGALSKLAILFRQQEGRRGGRDAKLGEVRPFHGTVRLEKRANAREHWTPSWMIFSASMVSDNSDHGVKFGQTARSKLRRTAER